MLIRKITFFVLLAMFFATASFAKVAGKVQKNVTAKKSNSPSVSLALTHTDGVQNDADAQTTLSMSGSLKLSGGWSLSLRQRITKVYTFDQYGGVEYAWDDLRLGASYGLDKYRPKFIDSLRSSLFFFVPSSEASKNREQKGKILASLSISKSLFSKKISLGYNPYGSYVFNRYTANQEGKMHTLAVIGNSFSLAYMPNKMISASAMFGFGQSYSESGDFQSQGRASNNGYIDIAASATIKPMKKLSFTLGYAHSDSQVKGGSYEFYAFNPESSSWFVSTGYSF
ncbi:MAG: hypothetical protein HN353_08700 [Bdellovibrionales bacterium]|jgi:hypothetical protein|nr:hypothetical protein [Bdellovibrionales bacterium]MBT3526900.1 hypothetical protein [Bdellovibrionales bacterium]MBT7669652.1 hypothetical protein [Bdellovibrionales bacterium]MBT7766655.1 hypothetical protein [Bdellovibrionales bacterium]